MVRLIGFQTGVGSIRSNLGNGNMWQRTTSRRVEVDLRCVVTAPALQSLRNPLGVVCCNLQYNRTG